MKSLTFDQMEEYLNQDIDKDKELSYYDRPLIWYSILKDGTILYTHWQDEEEIDLGEYQDIYFVSILSQTELDDLLKGKLALREAILSKAGVLYQRNGGNHPYSEDNMFQVDIEKLDLVSLPGPKVHLRDKEQD